MDRPLVLLATEGTYPYHPGGVSIWCDALVHRLPDVDFVLVGIAMNPYVQMAFEIPPNLRKIHTLPLWGIQDPSEHRDEIRFSEIFLQKQRTTAEVIQTRFIPDFYGLLECLVATRGEGQLGHRLAAMYQYFRVYDYLETFKSPWVWEAFQKWVIEAAQRGQWPEPTVFETVQAAGWLYHFLMILNATFPTVDVVHSSAAAFCGLVGIIEKILYRTPFLLTEHGVYLREQYLGIGRSNMSRFSKRFLLTLVRAVARENLFWADEIVPVCAFNTRWERQLGADAKKVRVIYNGVDPERFFPAPATSTPVPPRLRMLAVARIDPNKDLETLLRALALIQTKLPPWELKVLGSISVPAYHTRLIALCQELKLQDTVLWVGHSAAVAEAYRDADIVVQSSVSEAFPYTVIESMMSGVAMVATDVGGTREALGDTGVLVPARDPVRLGLGILSLALDSERRRHLGAAARQRALRHFTIAQTADAFRRTYYRLAGFVRPVAETLPPTAALIEVIRAVALDRVGQPDLAQAAWRRALAVAPGQPLAVVACLNLARMAGARGAHRVALTYALKARLLQAYWAQPREEVGA